MRLDKCLTIFKYFDNLSLRESEEDHEERIKSWPSNGTAVCRGFYLGLDYITVIFIFIFPDVQFYLHT